MDVGFADLHNHQFANLAFGERLVWGSPMGDPADVLTDCCRFHGPVGLRDIVGNAMRLSLLRRPPWHGGHGSPGFETWPTWDTFTHQGVHEEWLHRAVRGGLRLMVMLAVNNEWVSRKILRVPAADADDMAAVDRQLEAAFALQRHIDERCGGPGLGWYRIVKSSLEASSVISDGKLAVVLGIEVDNLFGARAGTDMTGNELRARLDTYYDRGVRHVFPLHFGDNGFGGGSFDNAMIRDKGSSWISRRNPLGTIGAVGIRTEDARASGYAYRTGRSNIQGLTPLGKTLIRELIDRGMMFDLDHMSVRSRLDAFEICREYDYPPVAGHACFLEIARGVRRHERQLTTFDLEQLRQLGGMVGIIVDQGGVNEISPWPPEGAVAAAPLGRVGTSASIVDAYLYAVDKLGGSPVALGTDFNGFACLPGPRFGRRLEHSRRRDSEVDNRISYPFRAAVTEELFDRSLIGRRQYDYNTAGLAHIGMLPDLIADFEAMGVSRPQLNPLAQSASGYVDVWSRAEAASRQARGSD